MGPLYRFSALLLGATVIAADEYFEGDGTSYTLGDVSDGNCNFMSAISTASTNYVALNQDQWDNMGGCGRCIEVACIDKQCTVQNKTAVVQVLDRCPECAHGALDLSPTVYKEITGMDPNRLKMRWRFVECPNPGNVQVCLKEGSNAEWVAVQPTNGKVGVKSVKINNAATTMLDGAYYYVSTSQKVDLTAAKVSITSIDGEEIGGTYSLNVGSCTDTTQQFGSGSTKSQSPSSNTTPATQTSPTSTDAPTAAPTPTPDISQTAGSSEVGQEADIESSQADQTALHDDLSQHDQMNSTQETLATLTSDYEPASLNITSQTPDAATETPTLTPEDSTTAPSDAPNAPKAATETPTPTLTPEDSTTAPTDATETPTLIPKVSTTVPSDAPSTPEAATETPTLTPDVPTAAPSDAPTQTRDASKCRVKGHK